MSKSADPRRLARAHQLTAELRSLQTRLNRTVEELCELVGSSEFSEGLVAPALPAGDPVEVGLSPSYFQLPARQSFLRNPTSGQELAPDMRFYSDYQQGLLHVVQQPLARHPDSRYSVVLNFSEFDGSWMSLAFNLQELLKGMPAGQARLGVVLESQGTPQVGMTAKCSWETGKKREERPVDLRLNQLSVASLDLAQFEPARVEQFTLHVIFSPSTRGSAEIRRLNVSLSVLQEREAAAEPASVFESAA